MKILSYFKSKNPAWAVAGVLVASSLVAGVALAQSLYIPTTLDNAVITIKKIFVSDNGVKTTDASILLDGANGNLSAAGNLTVGKEVYFTDASFKNSPCNGPTGCILRVTDGKVTSTNDLSPWTSNSISGDDTSVFKRTATNPNNVFVATSDGNVASVGNAPTQSYLRVGALSSDTDAPVGNDTALVVAGSIESRGGLYIKKHNDDTKSSNVGENLPMKLIDDYTELAITNRVGNIDFKSSFYDGLAQDTVFNFTAKNAKASIGINTVGTVSKTLDVVGDAAVSDSLTIGHVSTYAPGADKLAVNGSTRANAYYYNSDRRYKSEIEVLKSPLENLLKLSGYSYYNKLSKKKDLGVIAQEVESVFPDLVQTDADGYKSVEYGNLVAPIIEAIKELSHKIDSLFALYISQQAKIDMLEARIAKIEAQTK